MTLRKSSTNNNFKFSSQSARIFRQVNSQKVSRNNFKNKKTDYHNTKSFGFLNLVFVAAGVFSIISFGLILSPSFASAKVANAQTQKASQVTIITNFNSQESNSVNRGKSFLQPIQIIETAKK